MKNWTEFRTVIDPNVKVVNLTTNQKYKFSVKALNEELTGPRRETDVIIIEDIKGS